MTIIVNAENASLGRLSSFVAKKALLGEDVVVINAENAIISGKKDMILKDELAKLKIKNIGSPRSGPFHQRKRPDRFVRRAIRGMLPWEKTRGKEAFKRVIVYIGIPKKEIEKNHKLDITKEKFIEIPHKKLISQGLRRGKKMSVGNLCRMFSQS